MEIPIITENEQIIVLNKPAGIAVTVGPGNPLEKTIAGWLLNHVGDSLKTVGQEERWGIVHRLDKDTSGVLIAAKTPEMFDYITDQFRARKVKKEYKVLVWGNVHKKLNNRAPFSGQASEGNHLPAQAGNTEFIIDAPIARHPKGISKFVVSAEGKPSITRFLIERDGIVDLATLAERHPEFSSGSWLIKMLKQVQHDVFDVTLLHAYPETGRTHQIRVHLKAFGYPVVGDRTYETKAQHKLSLTFITRQFLHAYSLEIILGNGDTQRFEAPLTDELDKVTSLISSH